MKEKDQGKDIESTIRKFRTVQIEGFEGVVNNYYPSA